MITLKLAYRNLVGAGLRTWLNVAALSFTYVLIIWHQGFFIGMQRQAARDMIKDEIAGGQYWHEAYDPYDPLALEDGHGPIPQELRQLIQQKQAVPILMRPGSIYPEGRIQTVILRGIDPHQTLLDLPTRQMRAEGGVLPVMVGRMMAKRNSFQVGDTITIRWRDSHGTFDAVDARISIIMNTTVPSIDAGQIWVPLKRLQKMSALPDEASLAVVDLKLAEPPRAQGWSFKNQAFLMKDLNDMINSKRAGGAVMYVILLLLALLAVFDTQVLAIFKRRKEIGTLMALGMERLRVIGLFTLEGIINGLLAILLAAIYGTPILILTAVKGIPLPGVEEYGFALASRMFPVYSAGLVISTILIIMITITIVSYLPSRKISQLKPTDALKGKMT
jgi:ABC-type lipoprotein release transport system permease subunit